MDTTDRKLSEQFVDFIELSDENLEEIPIQGAGANFGRSCWSCWGWSCWSCWSCWGWSCWDWSCWSCGSCWDGF
ncbi:MAG TPA: hypothetical protein VKV19_08690 [Ktedonobacteraceae bacterium]|nr:hypothetical protein [Ktedonobacteraceae bacterium]